ncbi:ribbon-helix-helix domain-containing protein [Dactylosporangium sp. NPDC049742]|uniref:ribbon-helix-helix domain-containing protein n=1 Tax=Dactylosporangium sp. NPDC049742 TaxID=3154737 RepID=UPI00341594DA
MALTACPALPTAPPPAIHGRGRHARTSPDKFTGIRLPVAMVEELDGLADAQHARRSDVIREALAGYVRERTAPVGPDDAQQALEVLRKVVAGRFGNQAEAA